MKQNAGIFTAIAVVLAMFGLSSISKNPTGGGTAPQSQTGTKTSANMGAAKGAVPYSPCGRIQKRLQPFVLNISQQQTWRLPDVCYPQPNEVRDPTATAPGLDFVIATVPNPIFTHLPLMLDRSIEIIQQAAQDNNYSYDSSWLPWSEDKSYDRLADQSEADDAQSFQQKQPGVVVFRNSLSTDKSYLPKSAGLAELTGLAVFVVSELPTGGLNQDQFDNALAWIERLGGLTPEKGLKILGPTFSGSLPSLYRGLHLPRLKDFQGRKNITISSGSVSSDSYYAWFKGRMADENLGSFQVAMEGDSVMVDRLCRYIDQQGYRTDSVVFLSEDETAFGSEKTFEQTNSYEQAFRPKEFHNFGNEFCNYSGGPTYLYYPRDIATLRSAYEQQSIFSTGKQNSQTANSSSTTLRGDLSEPSSSEHDTVRTYGGQLTPLAQESILLAITDVLKEKNIQFVVLRSTSTLDQIFLSQFLRRSTPDVRIVLDGADLLFRRGAEGASLRGVMLLSTYPLLIWEQDWTATKLDGSGESYRMFGEDVAEGQYIAARGLFPDRGSNVRIANYAPPAWARLTVNADEDKRPATWLTVIGHRQFWPVAVLNAQTLPGEKMNSILQTSSERSRDPHHSLISIAGDPHPLHPLPVDFRGLLILGSIWGLLHFLWCWRGSISPVPSPFRLAYFAPVPRWQYAALIGFGTAVIASTAVLLASTSGLLRWQLGENNVWVSAVVVWIILLAGIGCALNYRMPPMVNDRFTEADARLSKLAAAGAAVLFVCAYCAYHWMLLVNLTVANRIPLFWRSIHLLSGVSPLLPQLMLAVGFYGWFWLCLRGLSLFGDDRPQLPSVAELPKMNGKPVMATFSCEEAGNPIESEALPLGKSYLAMLAPIFVIVVVICYILLRDPWLRTLGERAFGISIFVWLVISLTMILTDTAQCWLTWLQLRELLVHLDRLPVRRTLYALQGLSWRSVWAMSGNVLAERYSLISRQLEALRHLRNRLEEWKPETVAETKNRNDLEKKIDDCFENNIPKLVTWYVALNGEPVTTVSALTDIQKEFASIGAQALSTILLPLWRTEKDSLIFSRPDPKDKDSDKGSGPVISKDVKAHVLAAEEFFVLPYVGFIQNILGRIRTIVLGSLILFVATTLAMSSYPFDPLPVLGGIFLAVFVIIGTTMILIYAGMHRDATLSYITGSQPGELGGEFWRQLITFGIGPLLGLLTTLFPSITDFVVSWLQPSAQAIK